MATLEERATRERAVEDVQRTCKQSTQTEMTKLEQNLSEQQKLSKQVADCVAGNQAQAEHLGELAQQIQQDRQESAKAMKKLETDTKQIISASQAHVEQQLNTKLQEMQQNLQSFLRKQDAALQQRFQKDLEENAFSVKQQQDMLSGRLDGIKVDQGFCSKALDRIEKDLLVCQETHATFKDATDRRIGELSVELQRIKVSQEASLNQSAVQEKITSEIRSLKDGINSIKLTVDGNERMPSRPSSPSGDARSAGPLLRPLYCRPTPVGPPQAWQVQGVRVRSVSPPKRAVPAGFLPKPPSQEPMDTPDVSVPARISVSCHNIPGIPAINGEYHRVPGESANGMPLWKHVGSELWLYCGTNRRWFVGGQDAKEWKFRCEAGFIYSEPVEKGTMPDRKKIDYIPHTGIAVFGKEYFFGGGPQVGIPGQSVPVPVTQVLELGETQKTCEELEAYIRNVLSLEHNEQNYDLLRHNCNHYADDVAKFLLDGTGLPASIVNVAEEALSTPQGQALKVMIENMERSMRSGGNSSSLNPFSNVGASPAVVAEAGDDTDLKAALVDLAKNEQE
ncbi:desi1, partial [Symbiodinium microadriaticum]